MTNPNKVGIVIGALIGGWHAVWVTLVLVHWAQPILDFIFWAHMIQPVYIVKPFEVAAAVTLIVVTAALGYAFGFFGTIIWNRVHRQ
jgi:hypothetical protein